MTPATALRFGPFGLQPRERRPSIDGQPAALDSRALEVLIALAQRAGELGTKHRLPATVRAGIVVEEADPQTRFAALALADVDA